MHVPSAAAARIGQIARPPAGRRRPGFARPGGRPVRWTRRSRNRLLPDGPPPGRPAPQSARGNRFAGDGRSRFRTCGTCRPGSTPPSFPSPPTATRAEARPVEQSFHVLAPRGLLISLSEYEADQFLPKWHKKVFGKCSEPPASKHGSVFWSVRDGDRPRRRHEMTFHAKIGDGPSHAFVSRPGVFSYGDLDERHARCSKSPSAAGRPRPRPRLRAGCGRHPGDGPGRARRARHVRRQQRARDRPGRIERQGQRPDELPLLPTATMEGLEPASFDVILANPPYYANSGIAQMFVEGAKPLFKPGGRLLPRDEDAQPRRPDDVRDVRRLDLGGAPRLHVLRRGRA